MPSSQAISVQNLSFTYGGPQILNNLSFSLPSNSRCLLVGSNGAGKSTFLRILAGKRMVKTPVMVLGQDAYHATPDGICYLGPEWAANPVVRRDVAVTDLLKSSGGDKYPDRRDELLELLDIDMSWHMHQISDGERRRVQILLGLIQPFRLLLLDEVTVDLDVVVRRNLLDYLKRESERGTTIVYATHIFDGLGEWPTHITHMRAGEIVSTEPYDHFPALEEAKKVSLYDSPLLRVVEKWLRDDFKQAKDRQRHINKSKTKYDDMAENGRVYGDKYYNYWN
jgi:CCR4-NOT complex subunit CAF16